MISKTFNRNFTLVVLGQIISILGSAILRFALTLHVLRITGRADVFAAVFAVSSIPSIFFALFGGAIADRYNRRNLMVIFDFTSSAIVLSAIVLFRIGYMDNILIIGLVMALLSLVSSAYQPTVQSCLPGLVPESSLPQANGIVTGVNAVSNLIAPALGGMLFPLGLEAILITGCAAFFLSAVMEIFIKVPFEKKVWEKSFIPSIAGDIKQGVGYIIKKNHHILRILMMATGMNLVLAPFLVVGAPYILEQVMESNPFMYSLGLVLIQGSFIIGALMVGVFANKLKVSIIYRWLLTGAALLAPMALALTRTVLDLGEWPSFLLFFSFAVVLVTMASILTIYVITLIQKETPNEMLGKIMAIVMTLSQCAIPLGSLMYGTLFEAFKPTPYMPVWIICFLTFAIALGSKYFLKEPVKNHKEPEIPMSELP